MRSGIYLALVVFNGLVFILNTMPPPHVPKHSHVDAETGVYASGYAIMPTDKEVKIKGKGNREDYNKLSISFQRRELCTDRISNPQWRSGTDREVGQSVFKAGNRTPSP